MNMKKHDHFRLCPSSLELPSGCVKSPIDLCPKKASRREMRKPLFNFAPVKHAEVKPGNFTLDVTPLEARGLWLK